MAPHAASVIFRLAVICFGLSFAKPAVSQEGTVEPGPAAFLAKGEPCDTSPEPPNLGLIAPQPWSQFPVSEDIAIEGWVSASCSYQQIDVSLALFCDSATIESNITTIGGTVYRPFSALLAAPSSETACELRATARYPDGENASIASRTVYFVENSQAQPTITLNSPTSSNLIWPTPLEFSATAVGAPGFPIASVEFFDESSVYPSGRRLLGTDTTAPYSIPAQTLAPGAHSLSALATDSRGFKAISSLVLINSAPNQAPVLRLTDPIANSVVPFGTTVQIRLEASDAESFVTRVDFYSDSKTKIGMHASSGPSTEPIEFAWDPPSPKDYQIYAVASDGVGGTTTIGPLPITVTNSAPVISLTQPVDGLFSAHPAPINLAVTATDDQPLAQVSYVITAAQYARNCDGTTVIATAAQGYSATWTPPCGGRYKIQARATDVLGIVSTSPTHDVFITKSGTNVEPYTRVLTPISGAYLKPGTNITLTAKVRDDSSTASAHGIVRVNFFLDGVAIASDTTADSYDGANRISHWSASYSLPAGASLGAHQITANAQDTVLANGSTQWGVSPPVPVTVTSNLPPAASLSLPGGVTTLTLPVTTVLNASYSDPDGSITRTEFYRNGTLVAASTPPQSQLAWTPESGSYVWVLRVFDNVGTWTETSLQVVVLPNPAHSAPSVAITNPLAGQMISRGPTQYIPIQVAASVAGGSIQYIALFDGAQQVALVTNGGPIFNFLWPSPAEGAHRLSARAVSTQGVVSVSPPINVFVTSEPPKITIVSPTSGAPGFVAPENVWVSVDASDDVGVVEIHYYLDGALIDIVAPESPGAPIPLDYVYQRLQQGTHTLRARAFDAGGNFTDSAPVTVNVAANVPPSVLQFTSPSGLGPFLEGTRINLTAVVEDPDEHAIERVEFIDANNQIVSVGSLTIAGPTPTYTGAWTLPPSASNYSKEIRVRVVDGREASVTSAALTISVQAARPPLVSFATPTGPGAGGGLFVGEAIQLSAQVSDPDSSLGGQLVAVVFRRHYTVNGQPISADIHTDTSGTPGTYSFSWTVPQSALNQISTFSVMALDSGPNGRNTTTITNSAAFTVQQVNRPPHNVRFMPKAVPPPPNDPLFPAMPSKAQPSGNSNFDDIAYYRVQAGGVVRLCAFADDLDGNLAGVRFHLNRPGAPQERMLAELTTRSTSLHNNFCMISKTVGGVPQPPEYGFGADITLLPSDADVDVQFLRAEAFDTRNLSATTTLNPERGQPGHIDCLGDRFEQGSSFQWGSACVKFSIPIAVMNPAATATPCSSPGTSGGWTCGATRFQLPPQPVGSTRLLQAERYDAGGQGIGKFEKDFVPASGLRNDHTKIQCNGSQCWLAGFDNGETRRYSVTMPQPGSIAYTTKFKPQPYAYLTSPAEDIYVQRQTSGPTVVRLDARATAHVLGNNTDGTSTSTSRVTFFLERLNSSQTVELTDGWNNKYDRDVNWSRNIDSEQVWRVRSEIRVVFHQGQPDEITYTSTPSDYRLIRFVNQLPTGYVTPEVSTVPDAPAEQATPIELGEFENRSPATACVLPPPIAELDNGFPTGWLLQTSCPYGLPANDYTFTLRSISDGTEVDWVEFKYTSTADSGIEINVAAPDDNQQFPLGTSIGFQSNFTGASPNSTVTYQISHVVDLQPTLVAEVGSNQYPDFNAQWTPTVQGTYLVTAIGQLVAGGSTTTSPAVRFLVATPSNPAPVVSLTQPSADINWQNNTPLNLAMTASDGDGIASTTFHLVQSGGGTTSLPASGSAPNYSASWTPVTTGTYTLTATATDTLGATATTTPPRTITVVAATTPTVSISALPSTGLIAPASTQLRANVSGGVASTLSFEHDNSNALICVATPQGGTLHACNWDELPAGSYGVHARAVVEGQNYLSGSLTLVVNPPEPVSATRTYVYDEYERLCKVINPESGATFFGYDAAGNLIWTVEGSNLTGDVCDRALVENSPQRIDREYDEMNRLRRIDYPSGTNDVRYDYEFDGALKTVEVLDDSDALRNRWTYTYNNRRMTTSETLLLDGQSRTIDYAYNANGHLQSLTYPGGANRRKVEYAPNGLGQPTVVADAATVPSPNTYASNISYYPNGAIEAFTYGNGIRHQMTPNTRQLPMQSLSTRLGATLIDDRYHYDENGNVTEILDFVEPTFTRSMDYDALDRLKHVSVGSNFWNSSDYTYDALDNIRTAKQGARQFRYVYDNTKRLSQMYDPTGSHHIDFDYNPVGDVTSKLSALSTTTTHTYSYDTAHRLLSVPGVASYQYDGHGRRVKEIVPAQNDEIGLYNQAGQKLYSQKGSSETHNIYFGGSLLATLKTGTPYELTYLHTDALGSVVAHSSVDGDIIQRYRYTPYGEVFGNTLNGLGYTGHDMDAETGLTYMQQRYYDPVVGRFLSVDPVGTDGNSGGNFNRYWYANDNPYRFVDPDGREVISPILKDSSRIAAMINEQSPYDYFFNSNKRLEKLPGPPRPGGSETYARTVDEAIASQNKLKIGIRSKVFDTKTRENVDIDKKHGGGVTSTDGDTTIVLVTGRGVSGWAADGSRFKDTGADTLRHEIVGHAAPQMRGNASGNAIDNDNVTRAELGKPLLKKDPEHTEIEQ